VSFINILKNNIKESTDKISAPSLIKTVDHDVYLQRMDTCKSCEYLFEKTNTCKKCGCFMSLKAKLDTASCPIGKW
jgi:hypothetical protein